MLYLCYMTLTWPFSSNFWCFRFWATSDNVLDLVFDKLQTLSREARYVLVMASCLHSTIELDILRIYMDLENLRFDDKFNFIVDMPLDMEPEKIRIPGMILQPFVENAIEHGLSQKEGKGKLEIKIGKMNGLLEMSVIDDGIGREQSAESKRANKKKHKSVGIMNVKRRIDLLNEESDEKGGKIEVIDLKNAEGKALGTKIDIRIKYNKV